MKYLFFFLLSVLLTACGTTNQVAQRPHENLEFSEPKAFSIPEIERFRYNGITFFLLQYDELPLVNVNVIVNGGAWLNPADKVGLASITGTVLRSGGSVQYPEEELNELLENRAASMETGFGLVTGSAQMNVLIDDFDELLPVFTDLLKNPLFPQERLDLAKTRQRTAISRRNEDASSVASREFQKLIYGENSVYSRIIEYETLENITRDDLIRFHQKTYQGSNMFVGVVGDFNPDMIREQLRKAFDIFDEGVPVQMDLPGVDYEFDEGLFFANKSDMNQSQIRMGHIGGYRDNPDYAALQVMNQILSGGFSGRLMQEVRTRQGLAYSVYGSYGSNVRYPGVFYAGLSTAAENTSEGLKATLEEIRRLQDEPVTQQELDETKERIFNRIIFRYDSYGRILSEHMSNYNLGLPEDAFEQYIEDVHEVTVDDIYRVANKYLQPDQFKILIVGNKSLVEEQLQDLEGAFGSYTEVDISIPRPVSERAAIEGDQEAGREFLEKMADVILDTRQEIDSVEYRGTQQIQTPQGEMALNVHAIAVYPDQLTMDISTPMGSQRLEIADGQGVMKMGGQEQALPEAMVSSLLNELKKEPLYLALHHTGLEAYLLEAGDGENITIYIGGELDLTLNIDKDTYLPAEITYSEFDQSIGNDVSITITFDNWTSGDGVRIPYLQKRYNNGEQASQTLLEEHTIH